jgi:hypothetical protein
MSHHTDPSTSTAAESFQSDHRHVTPIPVACTMSPVPPLISDSVAVTNNASNDTTTDTADTTTTFTQRKGAAKTNTNHSTTSEKLTSRASNRNIAYSTYSISTLFPVIVHRMITESLQENDRSLIHWTDCGKYFWIEEKHKMLGLVLAKHFKRTFVLLAFRIDTKITHYLLTLSFIYR